MHPLGIKKVQTFVRLKVHFCTFYSDSVWSVGSRNEIKKYIIHLYIKLVATNGQNRFQ